VCAPASNLTPYLRADESAHLATFSPSPTIASSASNSRARRSRHNKGELARQVARTHDLDVDVIWPEGDGYRHESFE
jgi:hypothetical protein